jgi:competence protein ComEC
MHKPCWQLLLAAVLGFFYAAWRADVRLAESVQKHWEGRDVAFTGRVIGLPEQTANGLRFVLDLAQVDTPGALLPGRVQLGWYVRPGEPLPELAGGDCIDLQARLYRPHGSVNSGGFDYEAWLLERGIRATGNVIGLPRAGVACPAVARAWLDKHRNAIRSHLRAALGDKPYAGVIVALAVGDQDAIPGSHWTLFRQTGTTHLFSVSGLHITLFSALVFGFVGGLWRRIPGLNLRIPARTAGILCGFFSAAAYTALAGFGIPAQRTLLMLAGVAGLTLIDRAPSPSRLLAFSLAVVVLFDPWAAHAPGFWLSFGAVAVLLYSGSGRLQPAPVWMTWIRTQWAVTLALTPLLLSLFQEVSLVSPLANVVAIPLISLIAVPLSLLAALTPFHFFANTAHAVVAAVMWVLEALVRLPQPMLHAAAPTLPTLLLALTGAAIVLLPRGFPARWLGWLMFLPLFFPRLPAPLEGTAWMTLLDVGQGEAVLLRTARHALLFDAGPRYASGEDAGARAIAPALWQQGINRLDGLVLSHDDIDHTGGALSLLQSHRPDWVLTSLAGVPVTALGEQGRAVRRARPDALTCRAGQRWVWDGVRFEVLHPPEHQYAHAGVSDNNRSCVIRIQSGRFSALLTGDIDRLGEMNLRERGVLSATDVLVSPHHGSGSSSTPEFLALLRPHWVLIPVGYRNRYGHPHPEALARYRALPGVTLARTDRDGALTLRLQADRIELERARETLKRYWRQ